MGERIDTSYFWLRRWHSLTGLVLLVPSYIIYLMVLSSIFNGRTAFEHTCATVRAIPLAMVVCLVFMAMPLMLHMFMGLVMIYRSSTNVISYPYYHNWMYVLQRVSGFIGLAFVAVQIWVIWIAPAIAGIHVDFLYLQRLLSPVWVKVWYAVGTAALALYLCNGMAGMLTTWGIAQSRRSQFAASIASWVLMTVLWLWAMRILISFMPPFGSS